MVEFIRSRLAEGGRTIFFVVNKINCMVGIGKKTRKKKERMEYDILWLLLAHWLNFVLLC
jgi:hypothetical protein